MPPRPPANPTPPRRWNHLPARIAATLTLAAITVLLARLALFQGPFQPATSLPDQPIIDLHCHAAGIGAGNSGCFVSPRLRGNFRFRIYLDAFGVTEQELQTHGDIRLLESLSRTVAASQHVGAVVVLALDAVVDDSGQPDLARTEVVVPNSFIAEGCRRFTNLLFGASIHPRRPDAIARLDAAVADGAVLVKWIPSIMDIDPADPRFIPFYRRMAHHRIPLLSHTGPERSFTSAADDLAHPRRLRLPLEQGVTVIAAHASAGSESDGRPDFDILRELMAAHTNLFADISALTQVNRIGALRDTLAAPECRGRLVYGSDFPLINTALVSPWYFPLNLTETQRRNLEAIHNPWDRDVALKQALGVPAEIFAANRRLLRLPH
jgi:hypothetical protein